MRADQAATTGTDEQAVQLVLPQSTRVLYGLCGFFMAAFALAGAAVAFIEGSWGALAAIAFAGLAVVSVARQMRIAVLANADTLLVRNVFKSRRFDRMSIDRFRSGGSLISGTFIGRWKAAQVVTKDGQSFSMDATICPLFIRSQQDLEAAIARLNAWLSPR